MRAALSSAGFPSDMHLLVDACVAKVRAAAQLADDVDLEELMLEEVDIEDIIEDTAPSPFPQRDAVVLVPSGTDVPTAFAATIAAMPIPDLGPTRAPAAKTKVVGSQRWPIFLCAFVAGLAGGAALIASPAGQRPSVQRATHSARAQASNALTGLHLWVASSGLGR